MMRHRRDLSYALAAALLLLAGAARAAAVDGVDPLSAALLAAGLIVLGVWIREESGPHE